ncbi:MAG: (2Fe-2S)-binding protein [Deltaproteobacteria bacterium]|nr:MAG: (2Fe-2S)-binding protein [Deltaproteobacteria bacterium]
MQQVSFILNGDRVEAWVNGHEMLLQVLREKFALLGAREGCGMGECGACTVIVDGLSIDSCLFPVLEVEGCRVETIEGLGSRPEGMHPIQQAFLEHGASQCGFCTPGMVMSTKAMLDEREAGEKITENEIKHALAGNLCRCTGYYQIIEAVKSLVEK